MSQQKYSVLSVFQLPTFFFFFKFLKVFVLFVNGKQCHTLPALFVCS